MKLSQRHGDIFCDVFLKFVSIFSSDISTLVLAYMDLIFLLAAEEKLGAWVVNV